MGSRADVRFGRAECISVSGLHPSLFALRSEIAARVALMNVHILVTGGTFDKEYDELTGRLFFRESHLGEMLRLGRCRLDVRVRTLMMIDSLEMDEEDRQVPGDRMWPQP